MRHFVNRPVLISVMCASAVLLSGCFLQLAYGTVVTETIGENIRLQIAAIFSEATVAICLDLGEDFFECTYFIDGIEVTSTFQLVSELGFFGVLVDPLIIQVPEDATEITGTFNDGTGPRSLVIQEVNSFNVQPGIKMSAEQGKKFVIFEFPDDVPPSLPIGDPANGDLFSFELGFERQTLLSDPVEPITFKAMLTGKVFVDGEPFYIPLLPCVTDFTLIPELEISDPPGVVDFEPVIGDLIRGSGNVGCDNKVYDFTGYTPGALVYLPMISKQ